MKRVLRSCLDPLPRFLSTRGLAFLVVMLVAGTGVSVYEYLESTQPIGRHVARPAISPLPEVQAADSNKDPEKPVASPNPASGTEAASQRWSGYPAVGASPTARAPESKTSPAFWEPTEEHLGS
jgi:hypothetical protein